MSDLRNKLRKIVAEEKRNISRIAYNDYHSAKSYTPEMDMQWSNIYGCFYGMPQQFIDDITYALENYSNDRSQYDGEHPMTIATRWRDQIGKDVFDAQQMTYLTMNIIPALRILNFGGTSQ